MSDTTTYAGSRPDDRRESGWHPVNVGHLVMGIALLGLVAVWALVVGDVVEGDDVRWLLPAPWVLGGAAGLVALATAGRRGRPVPTVTEAPLPSDPTGPTDPADDTAGTEEETR